MALYQTTEQMLIYALWSQLSIKVKDYGIHLK